MIAVNTHTGTAYTQWWQSQNIILNRSIEIDLYKNVCTSKTITLVDLILTPKYQKLQSVADFYWLELKNEKLDFISIQNETFSGHFNALPDTLILTTIKFPFQPNKYSTEI